MDNSMTEQTALAQRRLIEVKGKIIKRMKEDIEWFLYPNLFMDSRVEEAISLALDMINEED